MVMQSNHPGTPNNPSRSGKQSRERTAPEPHPLSRAAALPSALSASADFPRVIVNDNQSQE